MELGVRKLRFGKKKIFEGRQKHIFKAFFFFLCIRSINIIMYHQSDKYTFLFFSTFILLLFMIIKMKVYASRI